MDTSMFLARWLGLYFLVMGILFLIRHHTVRETMSQFVKMRPLITLSGIITLMFGLALVVYSPWISWSLKGAMSFVGYLSVVVGILRFGFPEWVERFAQRLIAFPGFVFYAAFFMLLVGLLFSYHGFMTVH